jgi:3-deoxy-D-manno-octulosonic acid (KDO) 8-phosphate synthase
MRILILYRPNSEHGRLIEEFIHDFQSRHESTHLEVLSIDTREGNAIATLYDVMQYPAILVTQNDGSVQKAWQGDSLPLMDEIAAYATV